MRYSIDITMKARYWTISLIAALTLTESASGLSLVPGQTVNVGPAFPLDFWTLQTATLNVLPGAQTLSIGADNGSTVNVSGATVTPVAGNGNVIGVRLNSSTATILNSTINATAGMGLTVANLAGAPSTATVTDSVINGFGRGVNVAYGGLATLVNTQVSGSGSGGGLTDNGYGLVLFGGNATVESGSTVTGSNRGVLVINDGGTFPTPTLILDNSTVTGTAGSAIFVDSLSIPATPSITVRNGTVLNARNATILQVGEQGGTAGSSISTLDFIVDSSTLIGNVQVFNNNIADIDLRNNSSLTGNLTDINSLDMNASAVTGNLSVPAGSTVPVTMAANSTYTGTMSNIGSLAIDSSSFTGAVVEGSGSVASVSLSNQSTFTGQLSNIGRLNLNQSQMTGDIVQDAATPAAINLSNNSTLTGTVSNAQSMNMDSTSRWNMVNDSSVGSLALNGGTVNLRGANAGFRVLTLGALSGAGTFAIGTDLAGHLSDLINVTGSATGSHTLAVQNTGVDPIQEDHAQQVVHTGSGDGVFAIPEGAVDVGTFQYELQKRGTDWFLVQANTTNPDPGNPGDPIITPSTRAVVGLFSAAPTVWYGELSTLRSRMGELRTGRTEGGTWARAYGNKFNVSAADQVSYQQTQQGVSLGVDTPLPSADGQWLVGVMGGLSQSDLDLKNGTSGEVNSYYLGLYSTWISTSGYYVDAVIKANRFENKADVLMSNGVKAEGKYDNYGVGGSIESGKHIALADKWFVEPYVQLSSLWVSGENYGLDNGMQARSNHADSLLGKVGTYLGRTIDLQRGGFVQPYVRVAGAQEFAHSNKVKVNSTTFSDDLSGTRGEVGAGVAAQLTDVLQVHADVDYSKGDNIEQPWGVNIGIRYAW
ncbi:autotransporter outer membrane beta-barrel domain-containing protein [Pseudomonas syringae group sp. J309-1]|uniref:autotransporter outer membrane beta-barrel domain-containing protein n=1 Tax=Pseudomonas syringae group sp. J309-1 TaxID=3079588 RepID=UPI00291032B4|nr:autotransporter outer membrane beta-barrel domain-containing protein [Pseudomonas syringae group sp. J309-1]MDU8362605.1 autotransporter outer membrane beta-barrel domain-containing protein [Pseudomonas syringae group sp. J309-1]